MGGFGSGGHNKRWHALETCRWLEIGVIARQGLLNNGALGTLGWKARNGNNASIGVRGGHSEILLKYQVSKDDLPQPLIINEPVQIDWCPKHFGGQQAYFLCPKCCARIRKLFLFAYRFRCRRCHGLVHASSQEQTGNRATRKNQKLRAKLGAPLGLGDFIPRPKGMHVATFEKYKARIRDAEQEILDDAARLLKRLNGDETHLIGMLRENSFWAD